MKAALLWDLDGTLLTTGRAGVFAFEEAIAAVAGAEASFGGIPTSGLTDAEVAATFLRHAGVEPTDELVERVLREYELRLPAALPRRQGHVMPGVREVLEDLAGRDDVRSFLLTGNTAAGARAKLAHYDLARFFAEGAGAFCVDRGPRVEIARRALALANGAAAVFVIGDTPADVECGLAIGARTIAVATGPYKVDELSARGAETALERLPEPAEFRRLTGI